MATTLTSRGKFQLGNGIVADYGDFNSTDTSTTTLSVSGGYIIAALFFDAQNNLCGDAGTTNTVTLSAKALSGFVTS